MKNAYEWLKDKYYDFEEVKDMNCKITIKVEENQTIAKMWENGKCVNEAIAKCAPEDEFVYETGAKLALDRLFATKKNEINISDMVKIIDNGSTYPIYTDWVLKYAPEYAVYFAYHQSAKNGTKCRVVAKHTHDIDGKMLYLIQSYDSDACYLISEDGIEKVK